MIEILVERAYLPQLKGTPSFGISWRRPDSLLVTVTDRLSLRVCDSLRDHLTQRLLTQAVLDSHIVWQLTQDFFVTNLLSGCLRLDRVVNEWRWFGSAVEQHPTP